MCQIKINGVIIILTPEQLAQIDKQRSNITHFSQIDSYETACKVLKQDIDEKADYITKIRTIGKAVNSLIEIKDKFPSWKNRNQQKHYPYFECKESGCWDFDGSLYSYYSSIAEVVYLKTKEAADFMGNTFLPLYSQMFDEEM